MRTAARLDADDALLLQRLVPQQKLSVFARKDIIGDHTEAEFAAQLFAQNL